MHLLPVFYHDVFTFPLPEGHRFPEVKYRLLRERLLAQGVLQAEQLHLPPPASRAELALAHTPTYLDKVFTGQLTPAEQRRLGLPWSPQLLERARRSVGSTIAAAETALQWGLGLNLGGGTHHAAPDHGAGFCVFNDVVVAARVLQSRGHIRRALVIDCDVHQGDGTAAATHGDPTIFAFSIHGERNFPFRKVPGDLDIGLPDQTPDAPYLQALAQALEAIFARFTPDLVFYIAGADPYHDDRLGRLALTFGGLQARDRLVLEACAARNLPVVLTLGGGYARHIEDTVTIHTQTIALALHLWGQATAPRPIPAEDGHASRSGASRP